MKVQIEIDCTPAEARAFLGLPDVAPLNEAMVAEMTKRMEANVAAMQPDELLNLDQFRPSGAGSVSAVDGSGGEVSDRFLRSWRSP